MPDQAHEVEARRVASVGDRRVLAGVLQQPSERRRLLADLGQELRAGCRRRIRCRRGTHGDGFARQEHRRRARPVAPAQLGDEPVAVAAVDRAHELDDVPVSERVVRSNWKAGECSGTPRISDSSSFVTVGSIVWMPPTISMP